VDTRIQTAPGRLTIGNRTIGDAHAHGVLTVEEIVSKSSNVGTAKIALELPAQTLWDTYTGVGFAPVSDPRIVVAVMIDEPAGAHYGGQVAAPVFAAITASALRTLQVTPDAPLDPGREMIASRSAP